MEGYRGIKDGNWRLAQGEDEMRKILKECLEGLYHVDTQEEALCGFDRIRKVNYFGGEPIGRGGVEVRVGKFKNGKATGKDENTGEMIRGGGERVVNWIW